MKVKSTKIADAVAKGLRVVLKAEANSTSSFLSFQPKTPDNLKQFRSRK